MQKPINGGLSQVILNGKTVSIQIVPGLSFSKIFNTEEEAEQAYIYFPGVVSREWAGKNGYEFDLGDALDTL